MRLSHAFAFRADSSQNKATQNMQIMAAFAFRADSSQNKATRNMQTIWLVSVPGLAGRTLACMGCVTPHSESDIAARWL